MSLGILAHVKWFIDPRAHPTRYDLLLSWPVLLALLIALAAVGIAYLWQRNVPEPRAVRALERFARTGPLMLRVFLGISLIAAAVPGWLFVPSLPVEHGPGGYALLVIEVLCGLLSVAGPVFIWLAGLAELAIGAVIISGQITRPVMAIGFGLFTITLVVFGMPELIGHLPYYGIMLTLFIAPDADSWHVRRTLRRAA